jgi:hypothetical protein
MTRITHFIDRQFGSTVHLGTENDRIRFVSNFGEGDSFQEKITQQLIGKSIEEAQELLKKTFHGYNRIKQFDTPLQNSIADYTPIRCQCLHVEGVNPSCPVHGHEATKE